jgi:adenylate cyclase
LGTTTKINKNQVEQQLERILASQDFRASDKLSAFLRFVVEETLAGRSDRIKGYTVATEVFGRPADFDPAADPVVRIQAGRLRRRLDTYYHTIGADDSLVVEIPKGRYAAAFSSRDSTAVAAPGAIAQTPNSARPTIAVLPFVRIGSSNEAERLADGISEELTVGFTRFMSLAVIARQSTLVYRETTVSIESVSRDLGARFIVTGSVRQLGDTIRVATQLTDAADSVQLWAETMEIDLSTTGMREIEDRITTNVLARIGDEVGAIPRQLVLESRAKEPGSLTVYEATLAFYRYNYHVDPNSYDRTVAALEAATKAEPGYALAWAQLAEMYTDSVQLGYEGPDDPLMKARTYANLALNLDATCQQAHATLAYVHFAFGEHEAAVASAEKAIELNPNSSYQVATAAFWMGLAGELGRAREFINSAERLNPHGPGWLRLVPLLWYLDEGDMDAALDEARHFRSPNLAWGPLLRASLAALSDDRSVAATSYRELQALFPEFAEDPKDYIRAFVHFDRHLDALLKGLDIASLMASD